MSIPPSESPPSSIQRINKFVGEAFGPPNVRVVFTGAAEESTPREDRIFLLLGPASGEKATCIDALCNYFYGVDKDDSFRYHIANEKFDSSTPNKAIITYVFNDAAMAFRPIVVDVKDDSPQLLQKWLGENPRLRIDVVCVIFSATIRVDTSHEAAIKEKLSLFPTWIRPNQVVLMSNSDGSLPPNPLLRRLNLHEAPIFKVNWSMLFHGKQDDSLKEYLRANYWRMTEGSFAALVAHFEALQPQTFSGMPWEPPRFALHLKADNASSSSASTSSTVLNGKTVTETRSSVQLPSPPLPPPPILPPPMAPVIGMIDIAPPPLTKTSIFQTSTTSVDDRIIEQPTGIPPELLREIEKRSSESHTAGVVIEKTITVKMVKEDSEETRRSVVEEEWTSRWKEDEERRRRKDEEERRTLQIEREQFARIEEEKRRRLIEDEQQILRLQAEERSLIEAEKRAVEERMKEEWELIERERLERERLEFQRHEEERLSSERIREERRLAEERADFEREKEEQRRREERTREERILEEKRLEERIREEMVEERRMEERIREDLMEERLREERRREDERLRRERIEYERREQERMERERSYTTLTVERTIEKRRSQDVSERVIDLPGETTYYTKTFVNGDSPQAIGDASMIRYVFDEASHSYQSHVVDGARISGEPNRNSTLSPASPPLQILSRTETIIDDPFTGLNAGSMAPSSVISPPFKRDSPGRVGVHKHSPSPTDGDKFQHVRSPTDLSPAGAIGSPEMSHRAQILQQTNEDVKRNSYYPSLRKSRERERSSGRGRDEAQYQNLPGIVDRDDFNEYMIPVKMRKSKSPIVVRVSMSPKPQEGEVPRVFPGQKQGAFTPQVDYTHVIAAASPRPAHSVPDLSPHSPHAAVQSPAAPIRISRPSAIAPHTSPTIVVQPPSSIATSPLYALSHQPIGTSRPTQQSVSSPQYATLPRASIGGGAVTTPHKDPPLRTSSLKKMEESLHLRAAAEESALAYGITRPTQLDEGEEFRYMENVRLQKAPLARGEDLRREEQEVLLRLRPAEELQQVKDPKEQWRYSAYTSPPSYHSPAAPPKYRTEPREEVDEAAYRRPYDERGKMRSGWWIRMICPRRERGESLRCVDYILPCCCLFVAPFIIIVIIIVIILMFTMPIQ